MEGKNFNNSLSKIFSNSTFRGIAQSGSSDYFYEKLKKYNTVLSVTSGTQVKAVLQNAYNYLSRNYRNEYIYKNTIVNKILLGKHSLNTSTMLNEFKVGNSIADIIFLNGTSAVYEIKTELDTPDKLKKQIEDYKKVFAKVYLVTHNSLTKRYLSLIENDAVGLYSLSPKLNLSLIKEANIDYSQLSNEAILKALRKNEYLGVIKEYFGELPCTTSIKLFKECLSLAKNIEPILLHDLMLEQLKKRKPKESNSLQSELLPKELKHICLCINPSRKEYDNLFDFINQKI